MVTRTTTSPDVHATEPAAEMPCGDRIHDSASDRVRSRSICSRIAPCPARASSTPLPSRNTSGSWANSAMAPSIPRYREKERDGPIGGDARLQVHALPSDGVGHCLEIRGIGLTDDLR